MNLDACFAVFFFIHLSSVSSTPKNGYSKMQALANTDNSSTDPSTPLTRAVFGVERRREKRLIDPCSAQRQTIDDAVGYLKLPDKIEEHFGDLIKLIGGTIPQFAASAQITKVAGFFFGEDNSNCGLKRKLDEILDEIKEISHKVDGLGHQMECVSQRNRFDSLRYKVETLSDIIKLRKKPRIQSRCNDHSHGMREIISMFNYFLRDDLISVFEHCARYDSDQITKWVIKITQLSKTIMTLISFCDEANDRPTMFDSNKYAKELQALITYVSLNMLPMQFAKDEEAFGLRQSAIRFSKNQEDPDVVAVSLKRKYAYFDWDVLHIGYFSFWTRWFGTTSHYTRILNYCGSYHFDEKEVGKETIVAWSDPGLKKISENRQTEIAESVEGGYKQNARDYSEFIFITSEFKRQMIRSLFGMIKKNELFEYRTSKFVLFKSGYNNYFNQYSGETTDTHWSWAYLHGANSQVCQRSLSVQPAIDLQSFD